ncbi:MAG: T9SS type A sorting domain-containing protein [Saprospiraceae bacterium]|nr:T9SS type A sorting domain-containing protein [Saprospiraceae bacterium]
MKNSFYTSLDRLPLLCQKSSISSQHFTKKSKWYLLLFLWTFMADSSFAQIVKEQFAGNLEIIKTEPIPSSLDRTPPTIGNRSLVDADPLAFYSNLTNPLSSSYPVQDAGTVSGNNITGMICDNLTLAGTPPFSLGKFSFVVANTNTSAVTIRPRIRFYLADGPNGTPGTIIAGFSFNSISISGNNATTLSIKPLLPLTITSNNIWAGILYDNEDGSTSATPTQLGKFGVALYNPVVVGSSTDLFFQTTSYPATGSFLENNPVGTTYTLPSTVANFGWELMLSSTINSIARIDASSAPAGSTVSWTVSFDKVMSGLTASNFSLIETGVSGSIITSVKPVGNAPSKDWVVKALTGPGTGSIGLNCISNTNMSTGLTNTLPFVGEVYTITACSNTTPSVEITASPDYNIIVNTSVTFTAVPTYGGTMPTYIWKKNNVTIPNETGTTYTSSTLADGDKITVEMTSNAPCATPTTVTSNIITMTVAPPNSVCVKTTCSDYAGTYSPVNHPGVVITNGMKNFHIDAERNVLFYFEPFAGWFIANTKDGGINPMFRNDSDNPNVVPLTGWFDFTFGAPACGVPLSISQGVCPSCVTPTAYNVTGGGTYCVGGNGAPVGLSNSETGVSYQLKKGGVNVGNTVPGTGSAISFGNQTAGVYTVEATQSLGACTASMTGSVTVTAPVAIVFATPSVTNVSCNGGSNGSVTVSATGGTGTINYTIQSGNNREVPTAGTTFSGLTARTYTFTATDVNGCTATTTATVSEPTTIVFGTPTITNVKCPGGNSGKVVIAATGGTGTITYSISPSVGSQSPSGTFNNLTAQTYTFTATDANGCTKTATATVGTNINLPPTVTLTAPTNGSTLVTNTTLTATASDPDGTISRVNFYWVVGKSKSGVLTRQLLGSDNTAPYSYDWLNMVGGNYDVQAESVDDCGDTAFSAISNINVLETFTILMPSPIGGTQFVPGSSLTLTASVVAFTNRTISKVEFFAGTTKLGEDLTAPYSYTWNSVPSGNYYLRAVATDNMGGVWYSAFTYILGVTTNRVIPQGQTVSGSTLKQGNGDDFVLYQNQPNPMTSETTIAFNLPKDDKARLTITTIDGRVVKVVNGTYKAGYNAISISKSDLNTNGIFYYRLETAEYSAAKKMVIIE